MDAPTLTAREEVLCWPGWRPLVRNAPLRRAAIWRPVKCRACGLLNMYTDAVVQRDLIQDLIAKEEVPNSMMLLTDCHVVDPSVMFMAAVDAISELGIASGLRSAAS